MRQSADDKQDVCKVFVLVSRKDRVPWRLHPLNNLTTLLPKYRLAILLLTGFKRLQVRTVVDLRMFSSSKRVRVRVKATVDTYFAVLHQQTCAVSLLWRCKQRIPAVWQASPPLPQNSRGINKHHLSTNWRNVREIRPSLTFSCLGCASKFSAQNCAAKEERGAHDLVLPVLLSLSLHYE